jgi:tRNA pseudouridine55 synthase
MQDGVVIVDKPAGISSARVVGRVKTILQARKVGHAGTLDPFATGVLVCLVNRATRLAQFLLKGDKGYEAELHLGVATDTQDGTGEVIAKRAVPEFTSAHLTQVFSRFVGRIEQVPPIYSALKHEGVALYKLARRGRPVQKPAREVRIAALTIQSIALPLVRFAVTCSGGTYIRTLCADIGQALGCGGHLSQLRRTMSSGFGIEQAVRLEDLAGGRGGTQETIDLIPPGDALRDMSVLKAPPPLAAKIKAGGPIGLREFTDLPRDATVMNKGEEGIHFKILDTGGNLIAVVAMRPGQDKLVYCAVFA